MVLFILLPLTFLINSITLAHCINSNSFNPPLRSWESKTRECAIQPQIASTYNMRVVRKTRNPVHIEMRFDARYLFDFYERHCAMMMMMIVAIQKLGLLCYPVQFFSLLEDIDFQFNIDYSYKKQINIFTALSVECYIHSWKKKVNKEMRNYN